MDTSVREQAFEDCVGLTSVTIGNGVTAIGLEAFHSCVKLQEVKLGNGINNIGISAFHRCSAITRLECQAIVPPVCGDIAFYSINKKECILVVPQESIDAYRAADQWKDFINVEHITALDDIIGVINESTDCYNLNGTRTIGNVQKGIIIKKGNKVLVK